MSEKGEEEQQQQEQQQQQQQQQSEKKEKLGWYLPRKYRFPLVFKGLLAFELCLTIALLALFGIAAPNLYRTRLWQDGADNGFNSSPDEMVYTLANYRPYSEPKVWSQFLTNFNLTISVLSTFILLVKAPMFLLNLFYPPVSVFVHCGLLALYIVSAAYQGGSDTTDPNHPQSGPPWYLTKNCNVARRPSNVGYCQQAKASFACTIVAIVLFAVHIGYAAISLPPTDEIRERKREKAERVETLAELRSLKSPGFGPTGENGLPLMTPRTTAFNKLNGTTDLPFRSNAEYYQPDIEDEAELKYQQQYQQHYQQQYQQQPQQQAEQQMQPLPELQSHPDQSEALAHPQPQQQQQPMYFPPPPKKGKK